MKRTISSVLIASMLATASPAWADPAAATPVPAPIVSPLAKGQPAPYAGVLLSPQATAQIISQADTAAQALSLAVSHQLSLDGAQLTYQLAQVTTTCTADKNDLQAQITDGQKQNKILQDQLNKNTGGLGAPVWIGVGVVGGVVVTLLLAFTVSKL